MTTRTLNIKDLARRAAMTLLLAVLTATAWAQTSASYRAYNTGTKDFETLEANNCTAVTSSTTTMGAINTVTWYVVDSDVTVSDRMEVAGTVHLILADGYSLTASQGLHVPSGVTLNIYGQSSDTGQLSATWTDCNKAGIGGNNNEVGGTITIHGGQVSASTGGYAAGLGGGVNGNGGDITIYGGYVTAASGCFGAGIGGGRLANCGTVTIVGGTVIATAGTGASYDDSKAIGAGYYGSGGNLNIDNMKVYDSEEATDPVAPIYRERTCSSKYARLMPCTAHNYANGVCTICGSTLSNGEPGTYLAYQEATNSFVELTANNPIDVNSSTTTMGATGTETWYVVSSDVTVSSRITVNGSVHLILCDGSKLTANGGIHVSGDNSLSIYWQRACTGQLIADASAENECAGIGGGSIGNITATGSNWSAGIGGGVNGGGGSITIYNGNVEGIGQRQNNNGNAVGIGRGSSGSAVNLQTIDGMRLQYYNNGWQDVTYSQRASGLENIRVRFFLCTAHSFSDERCIYCGKHQWYTVTYNGNGFTDGSVPTDATHYANDGSGTFMVLGNMNNMARTGYIFSGWNTKADGTGINFVPGATSNIYGNITLYAKWIPITYSVRFHKNHDDATGTMGDQTFNYDAAQPLATNAFTCGGYQFTGWSTTASGSPAYTNGQSVSNLGTEQGAVIDLYAVWAQNLYTITYNLNGGAVASSNPTTYSELNQNITLVNPTKEGYDFMGWTGTGLSGATMTVIIPTGSTGNRTYTATWDRYYRAYNTSKKKYETKSLASNTTLTTVTSGTTTLSNGWYVVGSNVTVSSRITVTGTVNLILRDGAKLTVPEGITVQSGNTLNIYGQNAGTGTLYATSTGGNHAAIGARGEGNTLGTVNIHGGTITAIGGSWSAGIGGGVNSGGGTVNIYGGSVYAEGHDGTSEAIGKGSSGSDVSKTLVDGLCVKVNNNWTPVGKSNRLSSLSQKVVKVEVCTSHNMNNGSCTYCGSNTCRVFYYSNNATGGTPPVDLTEHKVNSTVTVLGNINYLERTHHTFAGWNTKMDGSGIDYAPGTTFKITGPVYLYAKWEIPQLELSGDADNSNTINQAVGNYCDVTLANHTLYRNGDWNTLVLPFSVASFRGTPLEGATVKTLASTTYSNNKLTLSFSDNLNSIEAGKPYIVKWTMDGLGADLIIHSTAEWNTFASNVSNGTYSYQGKVVKLAADISVSTMVGTGSNSFKGTFDGCGHTLTVNFNSNTNYVAPFPKVDGATIRNLIVAGSIKGGIHCSGLIGGVNGSGTIQIENCDVRAAITCSASHCGGYIGHAGSGQTVISNCRFSGSITGGSSDVGIFQGWPDNGSHSLVNCLSAGTYTNYGNLYLNRANGVNNCYKTQNIGNQGTYTTATGETLRNSLGDGWVVSGDNVVPKMTNSLADIVNPVFTEVCINNAITNIETNDISFVGTYSPVTDGSLLLDAHNTNGNALHAALCPYSSSGYTLNGWYTNEGRTQTASTIPFDATTGNVTLYSTQSLATFSITYDLGGGSVATPNPTSYTALSDAITLVNPTRNGYAFAGWTGTGINGTAMTVTIPHGSTGNRSYTATWVPSYTITYDLGGGSASNPTSYSVLSDAITLVNPTRDGYTFAGWTGTGLNGPTMTVTIPHGSEGNRSYTATWTLNVYTITYDLAGGSVETDNPIHYNSANETFTLVNPTREGYEFAGWTGSNGNTPQTTVTISTGSSGNRSYTANWAFIYSISYDGLEDGTFPSTPPTTYSAIREITLVNPVRELYDFAGWTGPDLTEPTINVTIPKGSTDDRTYHATWSLKESIFISYNTETCEYETHGPYNPIRFESTNTTTIGTANEVTWYFVKDAGVEAANRLTVMGTVNLILADGASLRVYNGIQVHSGNTLNIYGQEAGTGKLTANVSSDNHAAIGTDYNIGGAKVLGTINIHGGTIEATGGAWSAGIGGGVGGGGGTINIYGGTISATASNPGQGDQQAIGSGSSGASVNKVLANGLRVYVGSNSTPVNYNNRIGSLDNKIARVEPCTEHNWDGNHCTYCGAYHYHQITYNGNGNTDGSVPAVATFDVTTGITTATGTIAEAGTMERTGYTFTGWNTEADGSGSAYAPDETVSLRQSITLYAQWNPITYTITYDLAGGFEPTIPNPTTYTIESGDITLNNPTRVDIDEQNGTTTNYLFMGWTGTDLDAATQTVTISHGSTGNRTYTATWDVSDIPFEGMEIDHDCGENEVGRYFVKMPYPGDIDYVYNEELDDTEEVIVGAEETPRIVNVPGWFTSSFKVYDDGGKEDDAHYNPSESHLTTLILNAPEGKVFSVQGLLDIGTWYDDTNWLKVYDGTGTENEIHYVVNGSYEIDPFITSGNSIRFDFHKEDGHYPSNMDLIVSVIDPPFVLNLVENSLTPYGATVSWTGSSDSYNLQIAEGTPDGGESPLVWTTVDNASNPYTFDNLDFETTYSVRAIGVTDGQPDRTSNILSFTTLERCPVPTNLEIVENSLSADGATVSWRGFSDNYNIKLGEVNYLVNADFETGNLSQAAFTTTSSYPWTVVENSDSGSKCAKSASGNDNATSALELEVTLTSDKALTFSAKVSSESGYDKAYFSIDGDKMIDGISGDGDWIDYSYPLTAGTHTLCWYYEKDISDYSYDDCFYVDDIQIINGSTEVGNYTSNTNSYALTGLSAGKTYKVQVQADGGNDETSQWSSPIMFTTSFDLILANAADNSDAIRMAAANGGEFKVTLADRTLYKDGDWNTLCLPFNLGDAEAEDGHHFDDTPLEGATVMTLASTGFEDGTLTMTFADATSIVAGKPYIVKWTTGDNLVNPVFSNVLISDATANVSTTYADFIGTYSTTVIYEDGDEKRNLYLGRGDNLYYPSRTGYSVNACRAYFRLNGLTAGEPTSSEAPVRAFVLNFGDDEDTQGIRTLTADDRTSSPSRTGIYTLDGRKVGTASDASDSEKLKALQPGLYIVNGKKVVIKRE